MGDESRLWPSEPLLLVGADESAFDESIDTFLSRYQGTTHIHTHTHMLSFEFFFADEPDLRSSFKDGLCGQAIQSILAMIGDGQSPSPRKHRRQIS